MLFTFFISIVFIAEIIITLTIILNLVRLDKAVISLDETITLAKPSIKEISVLIRNISGQLKELTERFANKYKEDRERFILKSITKTLAGILLWKLNIKTLKKFRKSKLAKALSKGLSLLQIVV